MKGVISNLKGKCMLAQKWKKKTYMLIDELRNTCS